jgi:hypothetical protein
MNYATHHISLVGFVDDINILTYSTATKSNYVMLESIHHECEKWAVTHGVKFASDKYEMMHFSRSSKKFNMSVKPRIKGL